MPPSRARSKPCGSRASWHRHRPIASRSSWIASAPPRRPAIRGWPDRPVSVARLLRPSSIAIVGASDKVGPGLNAWLTLERLGYPGIVHLVTPSRQELFGRKTYPTLDAISDPVDLVFVAVPQPAVLDTVRAAAAKGAGGAAGACLRADCARDDRRDSRRHTAWGIPRPPRQRHRCRGLRRGQAFRARRRLSGRDQRGRDQSARRARTERGCARLRDRARVGKVTP